MLANTIYHLIQSGDGAKKNRMKCFFFNLRCAGKLNENECEMRRTTDAIVWIDTFPLQSKLRATPSRFRSAAIANTKAHTRTCCRECVKLGCRSWWPNKVHSIFAFSRCTTFSISQFTIFRIDFNVFVFGMNSKAYERTQIEKMIKTANRNAMQTTTHDLAEGTNYTALHIE